MTRKSEQGSALLLTIVVTIILLFVGGSLGLLAMVENRMAHKEEASMKAYYLARSGADGLAQAIISDPALLDDPTIQTEDFSDPVSLGATGEFQVRVVQSGGFVRVQSKGIVQDQQRMVQLTLFSVALFDNALVAVSGSGGNVITLNGADPTVKGTVALYEGDEIQGTNKLDGEIRTLSPEVQYPGIVFPDPPAGIPPRENITKKDKNPAIGQDGKYAVIETKDTLIIDVGQGVRTIVVDTLALAGPLVMTNVGPNGRLDLFVNKITGDLILNQEGEAKDKPTALTLYYSGTEAFKMTNPNKQKITGNIVIGYADVEVDNEAAEVDITGGYLNGNLFTMGSYVKMRGNPDASSSLIYAPNAKVEMTGGAFVGAVIAQTFEAKGNSEIVYPEGHDFVATFPKDIFGSDFDAEETSGLRKGTWSPIR